MYSVQLRLSQDLVGCSLQEAWVFLSLKGCKTKESVLTVYRLAGQNFLSVPRQGESPVVQKGNCLPSGEEEGSSSENTLTHRQKHLSGQ